MSLHSMLQAVRSPFYSFRHQNDNNKQNFDQSEKALQIRTSAFQQKLDKTDMSKEKKEVRNQLKRCVIVKKEVRNQLKRCMLFAAVT